MPGVSVQIHEIAGKGGATVGVVRRGADGFRTLIERDSNSVHTEDHSCLPSRIGRSIMKTSQIESIKGAQDAGRQSPGPPGVTEIPHQEVSFLYHPIDDHSHPPAGHSLANDIGTGVSEYWPEIGPKTLGSFSLHPPTRQHNPSLASRRGP